MIVKFTITHLEKVVAELLAAADELHHEALSQYPSEEYQNLDSKCVRLLQSHMVLSNILDYKYLDLNVSILDRELKYLHVRLKELESFYNIARDDDADDILSVVADIQKRILITKKKFSEALSVEFDVDLEDFVADSLNGIY